MAGVCARQNSHTDARSQTIRRAVWEQLIYLEHHSEPSVLFRLRQLHTEEEEEVALCFC